MSEYNVRAGDSSYGTFSTLEAAERALRMVQRHDPEARIVVKDDWQARALMAEAAVAAFAISEWKVRSAAALLGEIEDMRKRMQVIYEACGASCGDSVHRHRCMTPQSQEHEAHICEDCGYEWTRAFPEAMEPHTGDQNCPVCFGACGGFGMDGDGEPPQGPLQFYRGRSEGFTAIHTGCDLGTTRCHRAKAAEAALQRVREVCDLWQRRHDSSIRHPTAIPAVAITAVLRALEGDVDE